MPGMSQPSFRLSKWYLDVVDESGRVFIGYAGEVSWKGFGAPYTSILLYNGNNIERNEFRLHHVAAPELDAANNTLRWEDARFGLAGTWTGDQKPICVRLFENEEGSVDWRCFLPNAWVALMLDDATPLKGRGYAEQIEITCPPWHIPLGQLRWGRFLSEKYSIIWIEWRTDSPRQWVFLNGIQVSRVQVSDDEVILPEQGIRLMLDRSGNLESEKKIQQVAGRMLSFLPGFKQSAPARFLYADEHKWRSKALLHEQGVLKSEGWAIHELVDFGQ